MSKNKTIDRIMIMGISGAGKSSLSKRLSQSLDIPVIHLDQELMQPNWTPLPKPDQVLIHDRLIAGDRWIMEGNWSHTLEERVARSDLVIYLDCPLWTSLYRVTKRLLRHYNQLRDDAAPGCFERLKPSFYWFIVKYYFTRRRDNIHWALHLEHTPLIFIDTSKKGWEEKIGHLLD